MSTEQAAKIDLRCPHCGSADVYRESTVNWSVEDQCWQSEVHDSEIHDDCFCGTCGAEDVDPNRVPVGTEVRELSEVQSQIYELSRGACCELLGIAEGEDVSHLEVTQGVIAGWKTGTIPATTIFAAWKEEHPDG